MRSPSIMNRQKLFCSADRELFRAGDQTSARRRQRLVLAAEASLRTVFEALEQRQLLSTTTVQTLPFSLDFGADKGEITDKDGQGTGFTRVQANTAGNQYNPSLIDLDTTGGVLKLTTSGNGAATG